MNWLKKLLQFLKKQIFLLPVVAKLFPYIESPFAQYATGLMLRYLCYQFTKIIENNIFDKYCDISYIEYISIRTMLLCEYQSYVQSGMKWFLDMISQILSEDRVLDAINNLRVELRSEINDIRSDINDLRNDIHDVHVELRGDILPTLLTPEDLQHEQ